MSQLSTDIRAWSKSGLTRDLYYGATSLSTTLERAALRIDTLDQALRDIAEYSQDRDIATYARAKLDEVKE